MRFVIVTGLSGAGKSSALKMLEDSGYFCVDNLPISFLMKFAKEFSGNAIELSEDKRQYLHVAAVFANNFTNHIIDLAAHYCEEHQIEFDWLKPLINQTMEKIQSNHPHDILTGPAVRNDQSTIQKHLELLKPDQKNIYQALTKSIIKHYK